MYDIYYTTQMKKDLKLLKKRKCNLDKFSRVVSLLSQGQKLPERYCDHNLSGNYSSYREYHIEPDWLLIYKIDKECLVLILTRTGSHSDLF